MPTHSDFKTFSKEPIVGDILATRIFSLTSKGILKSHNHETLFSDGINQALCMNPMRSHESLASAPNDNCSCGFYVYDSKNIWWDDNKTNDDGEHLIKAVVRVSGKVLLCERGLRAQKIEILAVSIPKSVCDCQIEKLKENYPNIRIFQNDKEMLNNYEIVTLDRKREPISFEKVSFKKSIKDLMRLLGDSHFVFIGAFYLASSIIFGTQGLSTAYLLYTGLLVSIIFCFTYRSTMGNIQKVNNVRPIVISIYSVLRLLTSAIVIYSVLSRNFMLIQDNFKFEYAAVTGAEILLFILAAPLFIGDFIMNHFEILRGYKAYRFKSRN